MVMCNGVRKLRDLPLRIWAVVPLTLIFSAATVRLAWNIPYSVATISKVILALSIAVTLICYTFILRLLTSPGWEKLKSRPVRIGITAVVTGGLVALTLHTIRFLPSPEAAHILSKVLAILLLAALISVYPIILRFIWTAWKNNGET